MFVKLVKPVQFMEGNNTCIL